MPEDVTRFNEQARQAWDANAAFWNERMGEGNDFFKMLIWPPTQELLGPVAGRAVLDVACGNGVSARRLAALGARVVALDFSAEMIRWARQRSQNEAHNIDYRVADATDPSQLLGLGPGRFDAAVCNMALFDMDPIAPLLSSLARLLKPEGRFVFSVVHPCFNGLGMSNLAEMEERDGQIMLKYAVKVWRYLTAQTTWALAMPGQPQPQPQLNRSLSVLLGECFRAGFVVDGLEERSFPPGYVTGTFPLSWSGNYSEIPPVLVVRLRLSAQRP